MEPFMLAAATAVATTVMTKALEKTGEKLGEKVFEQSEKVLSLLRQKSPQTASAIEKAEQEPLDYGRAVLEVDALAKADVEFADQLQALLVVAEKDPNRNLAGAIREIVKTLNSQQPTIQNLTKLAEKIGVLNQNTTIQNQHNTLNI